MKRTKPWRNYSSMVVIAIGMVAACSAEEESNSNEGTGTGGASPPVGATGGLDAGGGSGGGESGDTGGTTAMGGDPSGLPPLPASAFHGAVIVGGVSDTGARVRAEITPDAARATPRLVLETGGNAVQRVAPLTSSAFGDGRSVLAYELASLEADTSYSYSFESVTDGPTGVFSTFPSTGQAANFTFTFGACTETGITHAVFGQIAAEQPLFHLVAGDFHYANIEANDVSLFVNAFRETYGSSSWPDLLTSAPLAYVWDDHDFGPNDSTGSSPARPAAQISYRLMVPHYPLAVNDGPGEGAIYQTFQVGRARFILSDLRSEKGLNNSMMSVAQQKWLEQQLLAGQSDSVIFWVSSVPWITEENSSGDDWSAYPTQRAELAQFIEDNGIDNIVMLAGDAHMLAADDGSNNKYGPSNQPMFPVLHAASVAGRTGSIKGGPYSEGTDPGDGRYGLVEVLDDGNNVEVRFTAKGGSNDITLNTML